MKATSIAGWALACLGMAPLCVAQMATRANLFDSVSALLKEEPQAASTSTPALVLEEVERLALAQNPEIRTAQRRVSMAESHITGAGALDDPQFMLRSWGVPLSQPWDYNAAQNMLMVGQAFPGRGKRGLRREIARSDVDEAKQELEMARLRVQVEVQKAFYDLLRAQDELRIHDQHVGIALQAIEAAKIKYTVGKVPQVEILKAQLALTRLAEHMIKFEKDAVAARGRLNTLLGRDPAAAIQVQGDDGIGGTLPSLEVLENKAMATRPDLQEAAAAAEKSRREQELAKKRYVPDFNVAAGYMLQPPGSGARNNYMLEGSVTLPWLNRGKHEAELAEAQAARTEKDAELDAMRNSARGEIQQALAEAEAAQKLARVYQDSLQKQAEETLHASVIAYENDQSSFLDLLDSQMTVVDIDLAWIDAIGEYHSRLADLGWATGSTISATQIASEEESK